MKLPNSNPSENSHPFRINTLRLNTIPEIVAIIKGLDIRLDEVAAQRFPKDLLIDDRDPRAHIEEAKKPAKKASKKSEG